MDKYRPSVGILRSAYVYFVGRGESDDLKAELRAEFDRAIANVRADAIRRFANHYAQAPDAFDDETPADLRNEMRRYADAIEEAAS